MNIEKIDSPKARRNKLRIVQSRLPLAVASALAAVIVLYLSFSMDRTVPSHTVRGFIVNDRFSPTATPTELSATFDKSWRLAKDHFVDQEKLKDWQQWQHAYDGDLHTRADLETALNEMIDSLGDDNSGAVGESAYRSYKLITSLTRVGVDFKLEFNTDQSHWRVSDVSKGGVAERAGLKVGDLLEAVDRYPVQDMGPAGQIGDQLSQLISIGDLGSKVELTLSRDDKLYDTQVERIAYESHPAASPSLASMPSQTQPGTAVALPGLGIVGVATLRQTNVVGQIQSCLAQLTLSQSLHGNALKGVVLDLRDVQGGTAEDAARIAALFIDRGVVLQRIRASHGAYRLTTYTVNDGHLFAITKSEAGVTSTVQLPGSVGVYKGEVVVLVDGSMSGAAELVTAALQHNKRGYVVGPGSAGKGTGQTYYAVGSDLRLALTTSQYVFPDGSKLDGVGIRPNLVSDQVADFDGGRMLAIMALQQRLNVVHLPERAP
jgi:C-terminal processing protease CtpA/Prc